MSLFFITIPLQFTNISHSILPREVSTPRTLKYCPPRVAFTRTRLTSQFSIICMPCFFASLANVFTRSFGETMPSFGTHKPPYFIKTIFFTSYFIWLVSERLFFHLNIVYPNMGKFLIALFGWEQWAFDSLNPRNWIFVYRSEMINGKHFSPKPNSLSRIFVLCEF